MRNDPTDPFKDVTVPVAKAITARSIQRWQRISQAIFEEIRTLVQHHVEEQFSIHFGRFRESGLLFSAR